MSVDPPSPSQATDEIIERCLNGDQAAWESIVRMYRRKVFNVAYKFVGRHDQAEDLTQDVFLKLYKSLDTFDRRANFQTWLISVSRNLCIDHYRAVRSAGDSPRSASRRSATRSCVSTRAWGLGPADSACTVAASTSRANTSRSRRPLR